MIKEIRMVRGQDSNTKDSFLGIGGLISLEALDLIMPVNSFYRHEPILLPTKISTGLDPYRDNIKLHSGELKPSRYIVRYSRKPTPTKSLSNMVITDDSSSIKTFDSQLSIITPASWQFNKEVASRFQEEAESHIPDYHRVIDLSIKLANKYIKKNDLIIDVGSALGYTIHKFTHADYTNVIGVESSRDMIEQSLYSEKVVCSNTLPKNNYQLIVMNWTLHFIQDKITYLSDIHQNLNDNGIVILTDKTTQSELVKSMYYQFKLDNGVSLEYINLKEEQLKDTMFTESIDWYIQNLNAIFSKVEIVNSRLGFTTFLCFK